MFGKEGERGVDPHLMWRFFFFHWTKTLQYVGNALKEDFEGFE